MPRKKELSFEEALAKLETIVGQMEAGDTSLKELTENYVAGVKLGDQCLKALEQAESVMDIKLTETENGVKETDLQIEGE